MPTPFIDKTEFGNLLADYNASSKTVIAPNTREESVNLLDKDIYLANKFLHTIDKNCSDKEIEQEIQAKGKISPRITPTDIEDNIISEHYFTAADGCRLRWLTDNHSDYDTRVAVSSITENLSVISYASTCASIDANAEMPKALTMLTFCVIVLRNGFTVTGESACVSPENFDADIGQKIARQNAIAKIWPLMGYALKDKLSANL